MKQFLKNILFFCLPLVVLFIGASIISKIIINTYGIFTVNKSVTTLILGHSQPECDLNDTLIKNTRNLAQGGEAYIYTYQKVKKIIEVNPQIKTILISFSNNQTEELMNKWTYGDAIMESYYPKYSFMMDKQDVSLFVKNNFSSFLSAETKSIASNLKTLTSIKKNRLDDIHWGGYLFLIRNKTDSLLKTHDTDTLKKKKNNKIATINIDYLSKIVSFCKLKKIKIVFMRLPVHPNLFAIQDESTFQKIRRTKFNDIPFLDFHNFEATNKEFGDLEHLNHFGAKRFSLFFNQLIEQGILSDKNPQEKINMAMKINQVTQQILEIKPI